MDESLLHKLQENYRHAFLAFAEVSEELLCLQEAAEGINLSRIQEVNVRIRDAQAACRDARDRLAALLLTKRREALIKRSAPEPTRFELLNFVSKLELLLANDWNSRLFARQKSMGAQETMARAIQA